MGTTVGCYIANLDEVESATGRLFKETELNIKNALKAMADATVQRAQMLRGEGTGRGVPVRSGALQSTGLVDPRGEFTFVAQFGAGLTYGRYQEFGPDGKNYRGHKEGRNKDGSYKYVKKTEWNYTTPGTGPHYLKNAGDSVAKEGIRNYL